MTGNNTYDVIIIIMAIIGVFTLIKGLFKVGFFVIALACSGYFFLIKDLTDILK